MKDYENLESCKKENCSSHLQKGGKVGMKYNMPVSLVPFLKSWNK